MNQESSGPPLALPRSRIRIPSSASIYPGGSIAQSSPIFASNNVRGSTARPILQVGRAPAPHLQRFRPNTLAPIPNPSPPSAVFAPMPSAPSSDLGCSISLTTTSYPQPSVNSPRDIGVDILESLLLDLPPANNEHLGSSTFDSRPNGSQDVICLSDDD
ncbi:hypothetical protein KSP40_PGU020837 [Platanthera guangdongensis]|uniref:Uncharacterized protein n=1 Tax=Platanthera guangdongensis TaxID=2320717 RepID=A0ABR2LP36_9ASPA